MNPHVYIHRGPNLFCSFVEGKKKDDPTYPDYILMLCMSGKPNLSKPGDANLDDSRRFTRHQDRKHLQEAWTQLRESNENKLDTIRKNFTTEHNYAPFASMATT